MKGRKLHDPPEDAPQFPNWERRRLLWIGLYKEEESIFLLLGEDVIKIIDQYLIELGLEACTKCNRRTATVRTMEHIAHKPDCAEKRLCSGCRYLFCRLCGITFCCGYCEYSEHCMDIDEKVLKRYTVKPVEKYAFLTAEEEEFKRTMRGFECELAGSDAESTEDNDANITEYGDEDEEKDEE